MRQPSKTIERPRASARRTDRRRARFASLGLLVVLVTLTAACGNRLSEKEILAKNALTGQALTQGDGGQVGTTGAVTTGGSGGSTTGGSAGGTTGGATGTTGTTQLGGTSTAGGSTGGGTTGAKVQNTAPITIGFVGALSGAGGVFVSPLRDAMLAWAKMVNARGGINGHPVRVLVGDDGINDARGLAIAQDFVENQGAIALSWSSNDISGIAKFAKDHHVPVIGAQTSQAIWYQNPYLFPMSPGYTAAGWSEARAVKDSGSTKLALLYCVEAQASCKGAADQVAAQAPSQGVQVVYEAGVSIAESDYTAECLQARNAGAQAIVLFVDEHSVERFAHSCHVQGYNPVLLGPGGDEMTTNSDMQGLISASASFPWFERSGSPGLAEYTQALSKYAPDLLSAGSSAQTEGWLSAKLFEQAAAQVPATAKPTAADILKGLWAMKTNTVMGLAPAGLALTFVQNRPATLAFCTFESKLENGRWVALNNGAPVCR